MADKNVEASNSNEEDVKKKGMALLLYDLKQRKLIPIKILFFVVMSSISVLLPFMTIHMKSLGINVSETAVIYGVFPPFAIIAPSAIGMVGDKLGNFKVLLSVMMVLLGTNALLFLVIPTGRFIDVYPTNVSLAMGCDSSGHIILTDLDSKTCDWSNSTSDAAGPHVLPYLNVTQCGYVCYDYHPNPSFLDGAADVAFEGLPTPITVEDSLSLPADWPDRDQPNQKYRNALFFRESWSQEVTCSSSQLNCTLGRANSWAESDHNTTFSQVQLGLNYSGNVYQIDRMLMNGIHPLANVQCGGSYDQSFKLLRPLSFKLKNMLKSDKGSLQFLSSLDAVNNNQSAEEDIIEYRSCRPQCIVQAPRSQLCSNKALEVEFDPQLTFWVYLLLRASFGLLLGGAMVLFEGAGLAVVMQCKGDLGLQRAFGVMGLMIFSPVSGALIDHFSVGQDIPDYRPAFYLYAVLISVAAVGILMVDLDFKPPAKELIKNVCSLLRNPELDVFFLVVLLSGTFWGYIESYLFWFLEEMGGNKSLMGLTVTVSSLSGLPALLLSDFIFRKIGHPSVQVIGFVVYTIRLIGYSYLKDPNMCLIYEAMEAVTTHLMMTSAVAYSAQLGTSTTLASIQGIVGGAYYGVGRGMGSLVGGFMMKALSPDPTSLEIGTRATFRYLGAAALATGVLYFFFDLGYIRRRNRASKTGEKSQIKDHGSLKKNSSKTNLDPQQVPSVNSEGLTNPVFVPDDECVKPTERRHH